MSIESGKLEAITEDDLQHLVADRVPEGKKIEYKRELPGNPDPDRKEFLKDVSSFANAAGGHLIYGIEEKAGEPKEVIGVSTDDADAACLRLDQMIRSGIEPRIPGVAIRAIRLQNDRAVIVIHIPRSWALPHRVTFKGHDKFYSRNSSGKYPLDVSELRGLFALSETTSERIRAFRRDRVIEITSGDTAVSFLRPLTTVLHLVPFSAFDPAFKIDLSAVHGCRELLSPLSGDPSSQQPPSSFQRYNFDGVRHCEYGSPSGKVLGYTQLFRNGIIESADGSLVGPLDPKGYGQIDTEDYERWIWKAVERYLTLLSRLNVAPPAFCMLTVIGARGYTIKLESFRRESQPIDRDVLRIPELMIESFDCDAAEVMKPAFDVIWNASGQLKSENYDPQGRWLRSR